MLKIFICEDNEDLAEDLRAILGKDGNSVDHADCGADARELLASKDYDLIILDWELPDGSGVDICKEFRARGGSTPILMLTGRGLTSDKETGLDSGADDYLTKPFSSQELKARLRALTRRSDRPYTENILTCAELSLDPSRFHVTRGDTTVQLVPKEFALLEFFMRNPNQVFNPDSLISHVWTADEEVSPDTLRTYIMNLRKKIDKGGEESLIETVHGLGYRLRKNES